MRNAVKEKLARGELVASMTVRLVAGVEIMGPRTPETIQPFDDIDDAAALARLQRWAQDDSVLQKILVDNPARLYDFREEA